MRQFLLVKNNKQNDKQPDYRIVGIDEAKEGNNKFINLGGAWRKQDKKGNPMLSCKLNEKNEYNEGWSLAKDEEGISANDIPFNEV